MSKESQKLNSKKQEKGQQRVIEEITVEGFVDGLFSASEKLMHERGLLETDMLGIVKQIELIETDAQILKLKIESKISNVKIEVPTAEEAKKETKVLSKAYWSDGKTKILQAHRKREDEHFLSMNHELVSLLELLQKMREQFRETKEQAEKISDHITNLNIIMKQIAGTENVESN